MKTKVEEIAEFVYDLLETWNKHSLSEHESRQDVAWDIAKQIYSKYRK